jgi:hypothetical protein
MTGNGPRLEEAVEHRMIGAVRCTGDHGRFSRWESLAITFNVLDPRSESEECAALLIEPSQQAAFPLEQTLQRLTGAM